MYLTIALNHEQYYHKRKFKEITKEIHSYNEIQVILNDVFKSNDNQIEDLIGILYLEKDEFDKIPSDSLPKIEDRNLDLKDWWYIYLNMNGLVLFEVLDGSNGRTILDPFSSKLNDIAVGDVVFYYPSNRYFLVTKDIKKFGLNGNSLYGSSPLYEGVFDYVIPSYMIRKATDYEIQSLNLKGRFKLLLDGNQHDNIINKYPWL